MTDPVLTHHLIHSEQELHRAIQELVASGFTVASQIGTETTLVRRKQFNMVWAVVGGFFCIVPLLVYLVVYALEKDAMVVLSLQPRPAFSGTSPMPVPEHLTWTADRALWWDGEAWNDPARRYPASAPLDDDAARWWDGNAWRDLAAGAEPWSGGWEVPSR